MLVALSRLEGNNVVDLAKLKQAEDEILGIVGKWPKWKQAIAYRYLYNLEMNTTKHGETLPLGHLSGIG